MMNYDNSIDNWDDALVNGSQTFNENQADHWGNVLAYNVFSKEMEKEISLNQLSPNLRLPGLNLTSQQLYFIAMGKSLCMTSLQGFYQKYVSLAQHSPNPARVAVSNGNMKEFSDAFNCPQQSFMNFDNRCRFW